MNWVVWSSRRSSEVPDKDILGVAAADSVGTGVGVGDAAAAVCAIAAFAVNATIVGMVFGSKVGGAAGWLSPGTAHANMARNRTEPVM